MRRLLPLFTFLAALAPARWSACASTDATMCGMFQCPCLCSTRSDDGTGWNTFYDELFGKDDLRVVGGDGSASSTLKCDSSCLEASEATEARIGACASVVDYRFCAKGLDSTTSDKTWASDSARNDYMKSLSDAATKCVATSALGSKGAAGNTGDCDSAMLNAACWTMFPRCETSGGVPVPKKPCYSACINEKIACRDYGSKLGAFEQIEENCAASDQFSDVAGPDPDRCTGAAGSRGAAGPLGAVASAVLACTLSILLAHP
jgi:hypothetical protein